MASSSYRVEAERWLTIAEKLLTARDLHGAKTFAIRARESDPRLFEFSDQIIAVVDTLLAGELRITSNNNHLDYYAILQVGRLTQSMELIATQYRKLALLLNPTRNRLSYSEHAFKLVSEAWMVFSNPSKKAMYDRELELSQLVQLGQIGQPAIQQQQQQQQYQQQNRVIENEVPSTMTFMPEFSRPPASAPSTQTTRPGFQPIVAEPIRPAARPANTEWINRSPTVAEPSRAAAKQTSTSTATTAAASTSTAQPTAPAPPAAQSNPVEPEVPSFWTTCPYCFYMYEYPRGYEDCALKCQNCKRAFHAVEVPAPPLNGKDNYFCCWGYFPLGFSGRGKGGFGSGWSPFSGMFATPLQDGGRVNAGPGNVKKRTGPKPKVIYKDDVYIELSDPSEDEDDSDDDWGRTMKKSKTVRGRGTPNKSVKKSQSERGRKSGGQNADGGGSNVGEETGGKGQASSGKRKGAKDLGKLDLNVMFNNEGDETAPGASGGHGANGGHGPRHGAEEDNIEGIGFFEGLDEFLSSLPILSAVGDEKAKAN